MNKAWEMKPRYASSSARAVTVHGVGDKNADAHNAEDRSECFEHDK
jgi:hypothetical protein